MATANVAFFDKTATVYPWHGNATFLLSLAAVNGATICLLIGLLSLILPLRLVLISALLLASFTSYFSDMFGVIIDTDMIRNALETNVDEAEGVMGGDLFARIFVLGILPSALLWWLMDKTPVPLGKKLLSSSLFVVASVVIATICILPLGGQYSSFARQHKTLRYYANPTYPVYSLVRYAIDHISRSGPVPLTALNAEVLVPPDDGERDLVILVIGETARADHFSLNGYSRKTNPKLEQKKDIISLTAVSACGTSTAISVPCMFSAAGHDKFDVTAAQHTENILDVLAKSGIYVLWRDNNSSSKGVADRVEYQNFRDPANNPDCATECRDVGMLHGLQEIVDAQTGDILIVLHQMGSHGPEYFKRYPAEFEKWKPACQSGELSRCSQQEIVNAYDNSILYTDYFLSRVIEFLHHNSQRFETSMLYVSDHGESLGESGVYLHGLPYMIAPDAQTKVPLIIWAGDSSDIDPQRTTRIANAPTSHDALFGTLLDLFEVETDLKLSHQPLVVRRDD